MNFNIYIFFYHVFSHSHGEDGDKVTQNMKGKFANYLFKHSEFGNGASGIKAALTDVIARMETEVLRGKLD